MFKKLILTISILFLPNLANAAEIDEYTLAKPFPSPNIEFQDEHNIIHNLSDYKGKVVLLNFWATWCEPCIHEMPALGKLAKFMADKNVSVLPISIDAKGASIVQEFYKKQKITNLPIYTDAKWDAFKAYKLQALPTTLIIDKRGQVVAKIMGEIDWNSQENKDYLLQLAQ